MTKPATITVTAKITAGTHKVHGPIVKGQKYTMREDQFAPELFERPSKDWLAPWERDQKTESPAPAGKKGR